MPVERLKNNATTTLNGAINLAVTTITVADATALPTLTGGDHYRIRIDSEEMIVTAVSGDDLTVTRGAEGTTAASHSDGATVTHNLTKAGLENFGAIDAPFMLVASDARLSGAQPLRTLLPHNELYWPPPVRVGDALDIDAAAQWWRKVGTPTGGVIYTTATASGISTLYGEDLLKCVAAASGDGLKTTWTYANEKRVKSGTYMAVLCAVYLVTASRTVTISLVDSTAATIASTTVTTTGSWQLIALEPGANTLAGSSVDFKATLDGAGTFYVVPLGALISTTASPRALPLSPRGVVYRQQAADSVVKTLTGIGDEATWTDVDCTSVSSACAVMAQLNCALAQTTGTTDYELSVRPNGSSLANALSSTSAALVRDADAEEVRNQILMVLDDQQIFEYFLDRRSGASTLTFGAINLRGWWEWA